MPATCPSMIIHSSDPIYRVGLHGEPSYCWLHSVVDTAQRTEVLVTDQNTGADVYAGYYQPQANYKVDCHVRAMRGVLNYHPGWEINSSILATIVDDLPYHFSTAAGNFIFLNPTRTRTAGEFHALQFDIKHLFPEGEAYSGTYPADPDTDATPAYTLAA